MAPAINFDEAPVAETPRERGIEALNKALETKITDHFSDGDVIRWESGGRYIYVALRAGGRWWISGVANYYGQTVFTYDELVDVVLSRSDVTDIWVTASWAKLGGAPPR